MDPLNQLVVTRLGQQGATRDSQTTTAAAGTATGTSGETLKPDGPDRVWWSRPGLVYRKMMSRHRERQEVQFKTEGLFCFSAARSLECFANSSSSLASMSALNRQTV